MLKEVATSSKGRRGGIEATYLSEYAYWKLTKVPFNDMMFMSHWGYDVMTGITDETELHVNVIYFDFDSSPADAALVDARKFLSWLMEVPEVDPDSVAIYFSGMKGFHIGLPIALFTGRNHERMTIGRVRAIVGKLPSFPTEDFSLYDRRRLIRIPCTRHPGSGLYKTPLRPKELLHDSLQDIFSRAQKQPSLFQITEPSRNSYLHELSASAIVTRTSSSGRNAGSVTAFGRLDRLVDYFAPAANGTRNNRAAQLAGILVGKTITLDLLQNILMLWNKTNPEPLDQYELATTVASIYRNHQHKHKETPHGQNTTF